MGVTAELAALESVLEEALKARARAGGVLARVGGSPVAGPGAVTWRARALEGRGAGVGGTAGASPGGLAVDGAAVDPGWMDWPRNPAELDAQLAGLCREGAPLRGVLAQLACELVRQQGWTRLGYARLSDYAVERLGASGRTMRSLAEVGGRLLSRPGLVRALMSGELGWTKVRLLARLPDDEDEAAWVGYARSVNGAELARTVRAVDRGSVEAGAADDLGNPSRRFEVRCTPEVRWKWQQARGAAARVAGRTLHVSEAAEIVAAEVLSALPIDEQAQKEMCEEEGVSWSQEARGAVEVAEPPWGGLRLARPAGRDLGVDGEGRNSGVVEGARDSGADGESGGGGHAGSVVGRVARPGDGVTPPGTWPRPVDPPGSWSRKVAAARAAFREGLPSSLAPLVEGLDDPDAIDAFEIDARLRRALSLEQRLEARVGPLLAMAWGRFLYRADGYPTREAWVRDRLGMDPTRARALVRLEHVAARSAPFARAYRSGAISWVRASALAPLMAADPLGTFAEDWLAWAGRVTIRRLRDDVDLALTLADAEPEVFRKTGGLPPESRTPGRGWRDHGDRELGANRKGDGVDDGAAADGDDRGIGANRKDREGEDGPAANEGDRDDRGIGASRMGHEDEDAAAADAGDRDDRGFGANPKGSGEGDAADDQGDRELGANRIGHEDARRIRRDPRRGPGETCTVRFFGPSDIVRLFRAVLCTVRRHIEKDTGHLPTAGEAMGAMFDHALVSWGALDRKVAARHRVFTRDGWRCVAPGCTSMQNLHSHHIHFRSAQGSDAPENRITLCAFHHLRGVHGGLLRCVGRAPDGLRWELGIRPGVTPLMAYRSGDVRIRPRVPGQPPGWVERTAVAAGG